MKKFEVIYKGQRIEVETETLWLAKEKASRHFQVPMKSIVWVVPIK